LGAAGAIEACIALMAASNGVAPPSVHSFQPDVQTPAGMRIASDSMAMPLPEDGLVLSNSFGFGGVNTTLAFARLSE
jgi:3-oxoacyl-[acyl-carrier-protein] synthase II